MNGKEILAGTYRHLSEFEWGSGGRWLQWLEGAADLRPVSSDRVYSFKIGGGGLERLRWAKARILGAIEGNMVQLERFALVRKDELTADELSILRSVYGQYVLWRNIVTEHIEACDLYERYGIAGFWDQVSDEGEEDEIPF